VLALALFAGLSATGRAQELLVLDEPMEKQFEFVRSLRQKGFAAIANDYIDLLLKKADRDTAALLQLEKARNSVMLAKEGKSPEVKAKMLAEARGFFEPFIKGGAKTAAAAQARTELAKLLSIQGQMALNKALSLPPDEKDARLNGAKESQGFYDAADAEFKEAVAVLSDLAKGDKKYVPELVQAQFDQANNLIDKAQAYTDLEQPNWNRLRAQTVEGARLIFATVASKETTQGLLAHAYLIKCAQEGQAPDKAIENYKIVMGVNEKFAEPAQRLARYFNISWFLQDPNAGLKLNGLEKLKLMAESYEAWLKDYPGSRKTYVGEAVRLELATTYAKIAINLSETFKPEKVKQIQAKKEEAKYYNGLIADFDRTCLDLKRDNGDFAERATGLHSYIHYLMGIADRNKLKDTFADLFLLFQIKMEDAGKAKTEPEKAKIMREALHVLERCIAKGVEEKVGVSTLHEYQFAQGSMYSGIKDYHRAAIAFEDLARTVPPSKKGAEAAAQAIQFYKNFADRDNDKAAREKLHDLADFVFKQKLWAEDRVIPIAHYNLAMDYQTEEKHQQAYDHLLKITKDFPGFTYTQGQAVFIALTGRNAEREKKETADPKVVKAWVDKARKALANMGPLPPTADATSTLMWFYANLEGPKFLYAEGADLLEKDKLDEAEKVYLGMRKEVSDIGEVYKKYGDKLAQDKKDGVGFTLQVLDKYWRLGLADIQYRKGNYKACIDGALLGATLADLVGIYVKNKKADIKVKDVRVMVESVNLALRAFIQLGEVGAAQQMYEIMLLINDEDGKANKLDSTRQLVSNLSDQVNQLKESKQDAKLKEMVSKFGSFADDLAKQLVYSTKNPDMRDIKILSKFYGSLGLYKKAADLYKVVPAPKFLDQKSNKFTDEQEQELWRYWGMRVDYGRLLREAKEYTESNKVLANILAHPNARDQLGAEEEQIHIYEDRDSYGNAIKMWKSYMEKIQKAPDFQNKEYLKKKYFEGYYHNTVCYYKYSQLPKTKESPTKSDDWLLNAAKQILRLETSASREGWNIVGPKFQELLQREKPLRDKYQSLKK
jgi:hypothetical protein